MCCSNWIHNVNHISINNFQFFNFSINFEEMLKASQVGFRILAANSRNKHCTFYVFRFNWELYLSRSLYLKLLFPSRTTDLSTTPLPSRYSFLYDPCLRASKYLISFNGIDLEAQNVLSFKGPLTLVFDFNFDLITFIRSWENESCKSADRQQIDLMRAPFVAFEERNPQKQRWKVS